MNKSTSILAFTRAAAKDKYILTERRGGDLLPLGFCKRGDKGKEFVYFGETLKQKAGGRQWTHSLYTTDPGICGDKSKVRITGCNLENGRACGDTNRHGFKSNNAILIWLEGERLTLFVFEGRGGEAAVLYQQWTAGGISLTAETDTEVLPQGEAA
jgi:hypothetical protein